MQIEQVASSHVKAIAYDRKERMLYVQFHSGAAYAWDGISKEVYYQFLAASSKGQFLHDVIRPAYGDGDKM